MSIASLVSVRQALVAVMVEYGCFSEGWIDEALHYLLDTLSVPAVHN